jgi:hypothetical protein
MRRAAVLVLAAIIAVPLAAAPVTLARLTSSPTSTGSFSTIALAAPTSLAGVNGTLATLTWTPSTTSAATGYNVLRSATSGSGYAPVKTVTPLSAATTTDTPANGTWYYVLQTYLGSWTSANSNEASVLVGASTSTGYRGCANNAAETSGSGDNNGYQTNPGNACALDGAVATDTNSGTGTSLLCTDAGKDRHRFWGYAFGLPGSVTSINGITVQLAARVDSLVGTPMVCVQLSSDSGTTWSTAQTVTLTATGITTYTLGGATNLWGQASWTPTQLGTSTFRIRLTDVASNNSRDFGLDFVGVQVSYTP